MLLLEWINSNGLVFAIGCLIVTVFLIGIDVIGRLIYDRWIFRRFGLVVEAEEFEDPQIDELQEYFGTIQEDMANLFEEMESTLTAVTEVKKKQAAPSFGDNVRELQAKKDDE